MRKPFAEWTVGDETFKLKLTTADIMKLEERFNTNLLNVLDSTGGMPSLSAMLRITHQAMNKFHHGKKYEDACNLFDEYCDNGGSQMSFLTEVFMPIYQASGFFSEARAKEMEERLDEAKEQI